MRIKTSRKSGSKNSKKRYFSTIRPELPIVLVLLSGIIFLLAVTGYQNGFEAYTEELPDTDITIDMVPIPGGSFTMHPSGTTQTAGEVSRDQESLHIQVNPFWMAQTEITWAQYELFADELPSGIEGLSYQLNDGSEVTADAIALPTQPYVEMSFGMGTVGYPAISMTHYAAVMYTRWLTLKTGTFYRLPTEAEWEYACRGGSDSSHWFDTGANENGNPAPSTLDRYEWYLDNSNGTYNQVGIKEPNPYGLYDMMGNIAEWTTDHFYEDYVRQLQLARSANGGNSEASSGEGADSGEMSGSDNMDSSGEIAGEVVVAFEGDTAVNPWFPPTTLYPRSVRGGSWMDPAESLGCGQRRGSEARWKQLDPQLPKSLWWHTSAPIVGFRVVRPLETPSREEMEQYWIEAIEDY